MLNQNTIPDIENRQLFHQLCQLYFARGGYVGSSCLARLTDAVTGYSLGFVDIVRTSLLVESVEASSGGLAVHV